MHGQHSNKEQERLLHHACCKNDVFAMDALLASGCDINCVYSTGLTPLMVATENGHEELVKKLILAGANLDVQSPNCHNTALHFAVLHCSQRYGEVLFFDFAGQDDYHGPH